MATPTKGGHMHGRGGITADIPKKGRGNAGTRPQRGGATTEAEDEGAGSEKCTPTKGRD